MNDLYFSKVIDSKANKHGFRFARMLNQRGFNVKLFSMLLFISHSVVC
jgi:hypothetical protein